MAAYRKFVSDQTAAAPSKEAFVNAQRLNAHDNASSESRGPAVQATRRPAKSENVQSGIDEAKQTLANPSPSQQPSVLLKDTVQKDGGASAECSFVPYNGGIEAHYRWSQTIDEVVLCVDVAGGAGRPLKGKDVDCRIERQVRFCRRGIAAP